MLQLFNLDSPSRVWSLKRVIFDSLNYLSPASVFSTNWSSSFPSSPLVLDNEASGLSSHHIALHRLASSHSTQLNLNHVQLRVHARVRLKHLFTALCTLFYPFSAIFQIQQKHSSPKFYIRYLLLMRTVPLLMKLTRTTPFLNCILQVAACHLRPS